MIERICPFCQVDPEHTETLEENSTCFVALSNPRLVLGHLLVIPKRHIERPWELTSKERIIVFDAVLRYQQRIIERVAAGCDTRQNCRPFLPQSRVKVDHVHFHLLPREFKDQYYSAAQIGENSLWNNLSDEEKQVVKNILG